MKVLPLPGGSEVPLAVRRSKRARHILLHVGTLDGSVELVLPHSVPLAEGIDFARSKGAWVQRRLSEVLGPIPFEHGQQVPILGNPHVIRHVPSARGTVRRDGSELIAEGPEEHLRRRVRDWLFKEARREITTRARTKALLLSRQPSRIAIRDQRTRWGSCSHEGNLNFSWRLIMAPERVLDYVVAHEVAHLEEMNHGPRFWALVDQLCAAPDACRRWLVENGVNLHRYG